MVEGVNGTKVAAVPSWTRRYEYSAEGYLLARHDSALGTTRYALDAAHRLIGEELPTGQKRVYEHDAAGNLFDHAGRLATYHPGNILADAGLRRYEHDHRHAVCTEAWQGGFRRFHRDERDQLVRVESYRASPAGSGASSWEPRPEWTARYDAQNRRIEKTAACQTTLFYWDTDRLAAEVMPTGALRVYVYADAMAMTPMLLVDYASVDADPASGAVYAVFADHLGCPERVEDMAGKTVWAAVIAPYGTAQITAGADFHQPLRWPGHYFDAELGLQYNRFRTYSPELGRYLEPDPLGRGGGFENVYAYTNNPLFRVDVDGLCPDGAPEPDAATRKKPAQPGMPEEEEAQPKPSASPEPMSADDGQAAVDLIHGTMPEKAQINSTTSLSELADGRLVLTNSDATRPAMREAARALLGPNVIIPDERGNVGYVPPAERPLADPSATTAHHGEPRGVQAGDASGSPVVRQWSSSEASHGGAACAGCESTQASRGIQNETGYQSGGGRYDKGGGPPQGAAAPTSADDS